MAVFTYSCLAIVATSILSPLVSAVQPVIVEGSNFVNSVTGDRFQIVGVDYQPGGQSGFDPTSGVDPLSVADVCLRDATLLQRLGVNTIRVYNLDPDLNHDDCASIFNAAGIYMILDVNSPLPNQSLNRAAPWESYNPDYLSRIFQVVEGFAPYPNTVGFFGGNEIINEDSVRLAPAYIRAVTRDLKDYISKHIDRPIGVGYSAADVRDILSDTWNYLGCGLSNDTLSKIDFFGLNSYSWCGDSSFKTAGYDVLVEQFSQTTIPVFFSEYGCNEVQPRTFSEVPELYGTKMTVLSGGLIYEYSQEPSDYGLLILNDNDTISLREDYINLQDQYNKLDLKLLVSANDTAKSLVAPTCEPSLVTTSNFLDSWAIPERPEGVDELISNGVRNAKKGKLVDVNDVEVKQVVYDVGGNEITGLKLNKLPDDQSNTPGSNDSGDTATTTESAGGPKPSKNAAVPLVNGHGVAAAVGLGIFGLIMA